MSANSSSLSFTPLTYLAGMLSEFLIVLVLFSCLPSEFGPIFLESSPSSAVLWCVDPIYIDLVCCFRSDFSVSSSICLRNSLMSSSHLFLGLPIDR